MQKSVHVISNLNACMCSLCVERKSAGKGKQKPTKSMCIPCVCDMHSLYTPHQYTLCWRNYSPRARISLLPHQPPSPFPHTLHPLFLLPRTLHPLPPTLPRGGRTSVTASIFAESAQRRFSLDVFCSLVSRLGRVCEFE